ncbi:MAG: DNA polymerase domain-containing protein [Candidatus Caldarchaeum sp.]
MGKLRNVFDHRERNTAVFDYGEFQLETKDTKIYLSMYGSPNELIHHPYSGEDAYYSVVTDYIQNAPNFSSAVGWRLLTNSGISSPKVVAMDIETSGLEGTDKIEMIGLYDAEEDYYVILDGEEEDILPIAVLLLSTMSPTLIVGHNISEFDIPHMQKRWQRLDNLTDEGMPCRFPFKRHERRFRVGMETTNISCWTFDGLWTAQVVDTLPLSKRLDTMMGGSVGGFSLKQLVYEWGLNPDKRTQKYHDTSDGEKYLYLKEDLKDTVELFKFVTEWFQGMFKFVPLAWDVYIGSGSLVNLFLFTWLSPIMPIPKEQREEGTYVGGHVELRRSGYFENVYSIDVVSMYPNIMVKHIKPKWDKKGYFSRLVGALLKQRLEAKKRAKKERRYEAVQKALKIVINSMYGYLAGGFFYSDKQQAEEVTRIGRETVQRMAEVIEENGGVVIEIDTDGIYFSAPNGEEIQRRVEKAVGYETELTHYDAGLFVKKKNYALWKDGNLTLKGNSLRSRSDNKIYAELVAEIVNAYRTTNPAIRLQELWQRCWGEYVYYDLKTAPKGWYSGRVEPVRDEPDVNTMLDRLEKLKAVFMRFDSLSEIVELMANERRPTWRKRIQQQQQPTLSI